MREREREGVRVTEREYGRERVCVYVLLKKKTENEREGESYGEIWRTLEDK